MAQRTGCSYKHPEFNPSNHMVGGKKIYESYLSIHTKNETLILFYMKTFI